MSANFKFIKYWGYFYLDSQYWLSYQYYFYFIYYKIKIIDFSSLKLMGMPDIFFKFFFKNIYLFFFSDLNLNSLIEDNNVNYFYKKNKNNFLFYQFIDLYNSFLLSNFTFLSLIKKNVFYFTNYPNSLFYVNYNIFSILFFFKFKYFFKIKLPFLDLPLIQNSLSLLGLPISNNT